MKPSCPLKLNLKPRQWIEMDGTVYQLTRRVGKDRLLVFETPDGLPMNMTDSGFLDLQLGAERRLTLLSDAEALNRLEETPNQRATIYTADSEKEQAETLRRHAYVKAWTRAGRPAPLEMNVAHLLLQTFEERKAAGDLPVETRRPSARSLRRWITSWLQHDESPDGLVPQHRSKGNRGLKLDGKTFDILSEVVDEEYFTDARPTAVAVHRKVKLALEEHNRILPIDEQLPVPGVGAVHIHIRRTDAYTRDFTRLGKRQADSKWRPKGSSPGTTRHNEVWEIDHTVVDCIVLDDASGIPMGRPTVTTAIDRYTRMIPGLPFIGFDPPGVYPTMEYLKGAILPKADALLGAGMPADSAPFFGKPSLLVPDLGGDFRSKSVVLGLQSLGIDIEWTPVHRPWYKGRVERFFRTLTKDVFQTLPGTTFSNIFERNKERVPDKVATVTLSELRRITARWVVEVYNKRPHRGLNRRSPFQVWQESVARCGIDPLPNVERVCAALSPVIFRKLNHYGVEFEGLLYNSADVAALRIRPGGERTHFRIHIDSSDLTHISVVDPETGEFIQAPIKDSQRALVAGVTLQKHKHAQALRRANEVMLGGDEGLTKAYALIDDAVRVHGASGGLKNRRKAAAYWDKLTRAKPTDEPSMFDPDESASGVTDGLFQTASRDNFSQHDMNDYRDAPSSAETQDIMIDVDEAAPGDIGPAAPETKSEKRETKKQAEPSSETSGDEDAENDGDELAAFARRMGMTPSKLEDDR